MLEYKYLIVTVWDKDKTDRDDLIGTVKINTLVLAAGPTHHVHDVVTFAIF